MIRVPPHTSPPRSPPVHEDATTGLELSISWRNAVPAAISTGENSRSAADCFEEYRSSGEARD